MSTLAALSHRVSSVSMFALGVALLATGSACKGDKQEPKAAPPATTAKPIQPAAPAEESVSEHMGEHAEKATEMRDAVALASLREIVEPGQWMAEHLAETRAPTAWRPYLEDFRIAAQEATAAKDYETAANAIGRMGAACAVCHEKLGGPTPTVEPPPSEKDRMQRHLYAVDLLWDGLIAPSDKAWKEGAAALAVAPMTQQEIDDTALETTPRETKDVASTIRALSAKAQAAAKEGRGKVYGEILKSCSDCHRLTGQEG